MAELVLAGTIYRESEFTGGLTGACGPNALSMAWTWSTQEVHTTLDVYWAMYGQSLCDVNGVTTSGSLYRAAQSLGIPVGAYRPYSEPWSGWQSWVLTQLQQGNCVLVELSHGQMLQDSISGKGEIAVNLQYHFILIVGHNDAGYSAHANTMLPAGWWACDGDNLAPGNAMQFYTDSDLASAVPCAAFAIGQSKGSQTVALVRNSDGSATDPTNGRKVGAGLATFIWSRGLQHENLSVGERAYGGDNVCAATTSRVLYWNISKAWATDTLGGEVLRSIFEQLDGMASHAAALQQQVNALQAENAKLQQQINAGGGSPSSSVNPQAAQALSVLQSLKSMLNTI